MAIASDFTITYGATKTVEHTSGTTVYTVLEFFQWLAAEFAATSQMDDDYAFVSDTPTVYRWVNGWAFGAPTTDYKYLKGGAIESSDAAELWANVYSIGSQEAGTQIYLVQNDTELTTWWSAGNIDILVLVKSSSSWIQSDNVSGTPTNGGLWAYAREMGDNFDHNFVDLSGGGRTPVGINTALDSGNKTGEGYITVPDASLFTVGNWVEGNTSSTYAKVAKLDLTNEYVYFNSINGTGFNGTETVDEFTDRELTATSGMAQVTMSAYTDAVAGLTPLTITFGTVSRDLNNGNGSNNYDVEIDCQGYSMAVAYEYMKYVVRKGSVTSINSDDGQEYRSASEGTYTDVKVAPFGTLAGTTMYGARGVWFTNYSAADFVLIDASGTEQSPPNYQKVIATHTDLDGSVSTLGGVTVFVAEITGSGGTLIRNQYTYNDSPSTATALEVNEVIDINKTPQSGTVRIGDNQYPYTSYTGKIFTVTVDPTAETDGADTYVPLLDLTADADTEQSDNIIYSAPFWCRTVVRRYGTKHYTADTQFTSTGLSFSPILADDPQAT